MSIINKILRYFGYEVRRKLPFLRPCIQYVKDNSNGSNLLGVEVGVFEGLHAQRIIESLNMNMLYLIDPYDAYQEYQDEINSWHTDDKENHINKQTLREAETKAHVSLAEHHHRVEFIKKTSEDAVDEFRDESLDFVYLDASHRYIEVRKDIKLWWKKVKVGGVIGGHNIQNYQNDPMMNGVADAVAEFAIEKGLKINIGREDWWFVK